MRSRKYEKCPEKRTLKYIHFEDHSADYPADVSVDDEDSDDSDTSPTWASTSTVQVPLKGVSLPDPHFLRIQLSLAHILHKSGAGNS